MSTDPSQIFAPTAAHIAGFSVQMLDYLEREKVFEREAVRGQSDDDCRRRGRKRIYTFRDLVILRAIGDLLRRGVSVRRVKEAILTFSRDERFTCDRNGIAYDQEAIQYFVTDGRDVYYSKSSVELVSLLSRGQQAFLFMLDVDEVRNAVDEMLPETLRGPIAR